MINNSVHIVYVGAVDSKDLTNRLAPLSSSTPDDKRRISAPSSASNADTPFRGNHKDSGECRTFSKLGLHCYRHAYIMTGLGRHTDKTFLLYRCNGSQ